MSISRDERSLSSAMSEPPRNVRTAHFNEQLNRLPERIQRLAVSAFKRFCENPAHPALRLHSLRDNDKGQHRAGSMSVTITMQYRAVYVKDGETNVWYWVGTHKQYDTYTGS